MVNRLLREPPFRLLGKAAARVLPCGLETKIQWEAAAKPAYAAGVWFAAKEAKARGVPHVLVTEFGVAKGNGLLRLQELAARAERETGVKISVFGFDLGTGLPSGRDFRDHPDLWKAGDYRMDVPALNRRLNPSTTTLVLGDVAETVPKFVETQQAPIGFVSIDLDFYSSTCAAFQIFRLPKRKMLPHVAVYFDDTMLPYSHRFAGELLAIDEFNRENSSVKLDYWRYLKATAIFCDSPWLDAMYLAHDLTV